MNRDFAASIGRARDAVADTVTTTFVMRHPDRMERDGDRATTSDVQDARQHIDFLQSAVELDDPTIFRDYALWCRDLLGARGVGAELLVENLEAIRDEMEAQLSPPAAEAAGRIMRSGLEALSAGEASPRGGGSPLSHVCQLYVAAAISGRREAALAIVREAVADAASPAEMYVDIFQKALHEVGRRWQTGGLTIAEEHMATATTQFILSVLHEEVSRTKERRGTAVVTGVLGEQHVVGADIVANILDADGWDVRYLGTNVPNDSILAAIISTRATLLAVSVTLDRSVATARDLIALVHESSQAPPRIIVGGAPFRQDPQLWQVVGADGFAADARSVADTARG